MELLFGHINNLAVIQLISNPYLFAFFTALCGAARRHLARIAVYVVRLDLQRHLPGVSHCIANVGKPR